MKNEEAETRRTEWNHVKTSRTNTNKIFRLAYPLKVSLNPLDNHDLHKMGERNKQHGPSVQNHEQQEIDINRTDIDNSPKVERLPNCFSLQFNL